MEYETYLSPEAYEGVKTLIIEIKQSIECLSKTDRDIILSERSTFHDCLLMNILDDKIYSLSHGQLALIHDVLMYHQLLPSEGARVTSANWKGCILNPKILQKADDDIVKQLLLFKDVTPYHRNKKSHLVSFKDLFCVYGHLYYHPLFGRHELVLKEIYRIGCNQYDNNGESMFYSSAMLSKAILIFRNYCKSAGIDYLSLKLSSEFIPQDFDVYLPQLRDNGIRVIGTTDRCLIEQVI